MRIGLLLAGILCCLLGAAASAAEIFTTDIPGSVAGATQTVRYFRPKEVAQQAVPLLVILHTWSGDVRQTGYIEDGAKECEQRGWALIHPNFQGENNRREACASDRAVQDVVDAVAWMKQTTRIDDRRIYLTGASGGGHMSLVLAGRHPEIWAGVSAWVPIADLAAWHGESVARKNRYADDLKKICGGVPRRSRKIDAEYHHRSPLTWLDRAKNLPIDIQSGITDGHDGSVPISHSLHAFNLLAQVNGKEDQRFSDEEIAELVREPKVPEKLKSPVDEPRKHPVLIRRIAGPARITIFQGGHEGDLPTALRWLAEQSRSK